ncbi:Ig-like domain-containing protein [Methylobacterium sp. E-025]|uniref:SdrD B-like domain-containing protein n=1 Tax=Methylobacterium sp. E-025 TaxID=2836561 RepID=UPI001FB96946|nr:SdrD B-like domain-containing protein [Methylobacterium sp. E-025]MCJ2112006.1 Ig-like domain-containing protein [Methylobacterium sp. E-025]
MAVYGSLKGHTFFDTNGNGTQEYGEGNLFGGFPVGLYSADGRTLIATTLTDANGNYDFGQCPDGTYAIRFGSGGGFRGDQATMTADGASWITNVTVGSGAATTVDQGFYVGGGGTIGGTVGTDLDGDGQVTAGEGQGGVIVRAFDGVGNLVGSTSTDANGHYGFSGLAGAYTVQVVNPLGQTVVGSAYKAVATSVASGSDGNSFVLAAAPTLAPSAGSGSVGGHTFFDTDADGSQQAGEYSLGAGFPIDLYNAGGTVLYGSTATDANGNFIFANLADGTYALRFHTSGGFHGDQGITTADGFNWQAVRVDHGAPTLVSQGFNLAPAGSINGIVYADSNGNGRIDTSDGGQTGAVVTLYDASGHAIQSTTTGPNGAWAFLGLGGGQYTVAFDPGLGNAVVDAPASVSRTVVNGTAVNYEHTLVTGAAKVAAGLSGTVFADANGNGRFDAGEAGVAGAHVAVMDSGGYVVATLTADPNGHYTLPDPYAGQNYRVVVSPPAGFASEDARGVSGLALVPGQALDHVDLAVVAAIPPATVVPPTVSKVINVVVRGQSNTYYPTVEGQIEVMRQEIQKLLGFDGINQRVNVVATSNDPNKADTEIGGTSLTADWLHPNGTDWSSTYLERGYLSAINQLPATDRGAPTAIVMLHNEWDSNFTTGLTADRWMSAMRYEAGLARAVLGLSANDAPYLFVSPIPFAAGAPQQPLQNQAIAVGQAELSTDAAFNAKVVTLQSNDVTMDHDGANGGFHLNTQDQQALYGRAALGLAQQFAASAMPGSPISLANGNIDNLGPQVTQVSAVAGHANQLLVTLAFDQAASLQGLDGVAASGTGWSVRAGYDDATAEANGTAAQIVDANHLLLTFDTAVPAGERLFYSWGSLRLQQNNGPGNGNAIYDNNALPLSVDPHGMPIGYVAAGGPAITGTVANQTTAQAAMSPFATTTLADPNLGATDTLRITVTGAGGTLSGAGLVATNDGAYILSGSAATITAALHALTFAPTIGQPGTTTFTLQAISNAYPTAAMDSTTSVVIKAPGITTALAQDTGTSAIDGITANATVSGVTNAGATVTLVDEAGRTVGSATADANGQYAIAPAGLADGVHTLTATETYLGVAAGSARVGLVLDRAAPGTPGLALAHDTGASASDRITSDASLTVKAAETGGKLGYVVDGSAVGAYDPSTLKDGAHTVSVTQSDAAGNVSAARTVGFTLDHTAPVAPTIALAHDTGFSSTDRITADATLKVTPAEAGGKLSYVVDGSAVAAYNPSTLKDGAHTVSVVQTDAAGNASVAGSLGFVLDHVAPTLKADTASGTGFAAALAGNVLANDTGAAGLHLVAVQFGNGPSHVVPASGTVQAYDPSGTLTVSADGSYSYQPTKVGHAVYTETVADAAGNTSQTALTLNVAKAAIPSSLSFGFALTEAHFDFRDGHDLLTAPNGTVTDLTGVATIAFTDGTVREKDGSPLVDDLYYDAHNLDVWRAHIDPDTHYAQYGWHEGRDPNASFSTNAYLAANPKLGPAGVNPLTHYDVRGWRDGRSPGADFSAEAYLAANPDVAAAKIDPLKHYLATGQSEGRAAFPGLTIANGTGDHLYGDFDATYYLAHNLDVAAAARSQSGSADSFAFTHYLTTGAHEGRDPNAYFSTDGYLAANPDVAASGTNPLLHYEQTGWFAGRDPSTAFHTDAYLAANPDVAALGMDPLHHYLQFGMAEGRHLA